MKVKKNKNKAVPKTIGEIIKEQREQHGLTREEIASFFDDKIERIDAWENNLIEPSISECKILSKLFSVSLDEMFASVDVMSLVSNQPAFEAVTQLNRLSNRWYE